MRPKKKHLALALACQPPHQYIDAVVIKSDFMWLLLDEPIRSGTDYRKWLNLG